LVAFQPPDLLKLAAPALRLSVRSTGEADRFRCGRGLDGDACSISR